MDTLATGGSERTKLPGFVDLAIYDDVLPSPASPFRTLEYGHYLKFFPSSLLVSTEEWHFGFAHAGLGDLRADLPIDEELKRRIIALDAARDLVPKLAYVTFLGNAQRLLPYFEARRIPFILQLYPGGAFEPNVKASDDQLRKVVHSPFCRKVIATQKLTREHLLERIGCAPDKIELIYGGVFETRVDFDFSRDKQLYGTHKDTIDLCFVAHRYSDDMAQKGYDQFVEVARLLASDERLRFHVVGDYTADDLPLGEAGARFVFYGAQPSAFFEDFYPRMDVIVSANRPVRGREGPFDGFPTGGCMEAGFRGVLNCIADPLDLNVAFEDGHNILLVDRNAERTARRLAALFATPDRLYELARANWKRFHEVFDANRQLWARTRLIVAELLRDEALIMRPPAALSRLAAVTPKPVVTQSEPLKLWTGPVTLSEETIEILVAEVWREGRQLEKEPVKLTEETIKALAAQVWRERRRRRLTYKIWREASRALKRFTRKPI
jgi:glycosyltransferase involved in cell wall biosynthesis